MATPTINILVGKHFYSVINETTCPPMKKLRLRKSMSACMPQAEETKIVLVCRDTPWWVTVRKSKEDGRPWIEDGWRVFAQVMQLRYLDFITFCYEGDGRFVTTVFDFSSIRSPCNLLNVENDEMWERDVCFEVEIQDSHRGRNAKMIVPEQFVEVTKLNKYSGLLLMEGDSMAWEVKLKREILLGGGGRIIFSTGWRTFLAKNKIKVGDFLVFKVHDQPHSIGSFLNMKVDIVRYS